MACIPGGDPVPMVFSGCSQRPSAPSDVRASDIHPTPSGGRRKGRVSTGCGGRRKGAGWSPRLSSAKSRFPCGN